MHRYAKKETHQVTGQRLEPSTIHGEIKKDIAETVPSWLLTTRAYSSLGCPESQKEPRLMSPRQIGGLLCPGLAPGPSMS